MSSLTILSGARSERVSFTEGATLLEVIRSAGYPLLAPCGGNGICNNCRVELLTGTWSREVLACQTPAKNSMRVRIPESAATSTDTESSTEGETTSNAADDPSGAADENLGAAVDLGTTTIAVSLYDTRTKTLLTENSDWNALISYGGDVISRIQYCMEHENGLEELSHLLRKQVWDMIGSRPSRIVIAGNTVMQHLFAGLDPSGMGASPFEPLTRFDDKNTWHFPELPGADITFMPCVSGYIGGDITAGLTQAHARSLSGVTLYLDIGTNGEMALCQNGKILCCAAACGPAFEGAGITCGMPALPGAVRHVSYNSIRPNYTTISKANGFPAPPAGICGSGLVDLCAVLLDTGVIDETGLLLPPDEAPDMMRRFLTEDENGSGTFWLTDNHTVCLTAGDVRALQLAKAAVAAGIEILLSEAGISTDEIDRVLLAGSFGKHLNAKNAARIGMIPEGFAEKITCIGNSSLKGAVLRLLEPDVQESLLQTQEACSYLELSTHPQFNDCFIDHMMF